MARQVRIAEYLADELEKIAARENRSLANLVNKLLEQAIEMDQRAAADTKTEKVRPGVTAQRFDHAGGRTPAGLAPGGGGTNADAESRDVRARTVEPGRRRITSSRIRNRRGKRR